MRPRFKFPDRYITTIAKRAIDEDIGSGDLTADLIPDVPLEARLVSRESAVLAGSDFFDEAFRLLDGGIDVRWNTEDGRTVQSGDELCVVTGRAHPLLSGERSAINLLQTLSGTATQTRRYVDLLAGTNARVLDTRKTIPGLRLAQKYAVLCGGGHNHRIGLFDGILIKENHLRSETTIEQLIANAKQRSRGDLLIEIEVENLTELQAALDAGAPRILLDNFSVERLEQAVALTAGRALLEASGGVDENTVRAIAETGVDFISIGAMTKNVIAADFSLLVE
jgi:nicotinate-nucleotide pyrophosphorylase (carboxylating)